MGDDTLNTLTVLIDCRGIAHIEDTGELRAVMGEGVEVTLDDAHIAELQSRGWVELLDLPGHELLLTVTGAGRYHGERWLRQRARTRAQDIRGSRGK